MPKSPKRFEVKHLDYFKPALTTPKSPLRTEFEALGVTVNETTFAGRPFVIVSRVYPLEAEWKMVFESFKACCWPVFKAHGYLVNATATVINKEWTARIVRMSATGPGTYDESHREYAAIRQMELST